MRDKLKNEDYFRNNIVVIYEGIERFYHWIKTGKTPKDRINVVKQAMVEDYISVISCKYSVGENPIELKDDLLKAINLTDESWVENAWKIEAGKPRGSVILNQYCLSAYDQMLWMLSLGHLLDIPNEEFQKLVDVIDRDQVKDFLFEFIIRAKIKDRQPIEEESYQKYFGIPKVFEILRLAIVESDKKQAGLLVKKFVRQWYIKHRSQGWYDSHKSINNTYFGYWSFETAAVVKIMDLDDSSFRDCQYYPKDLIEYKQNNINIS